jgi:hypothetical protein
MNLISSRSPSIGHGSGAVPMDLRISFAPIDGAATCMRRDKQAERKEKQD